MKISIFSLSLCLLAIVSHQSNGQEGSTLLGEAYQSGVSIVGEKLSIELPDKWILSDRVNGTLASAESMNPNSTAGRILVYLSRNDVDAETKAISSTLAKTGKLIFQGESDAGDSGNRHLRWWLVDKDGAVQYHLAHLRVDVDSSNKLSQLSILRLRYPVSSDTTPSDFLETKALALQGEIESTVDHFYGTFNKELIGSGLIYNGILAEGTAKVTLQLPPPFLYATAYRNDVQRWVSAENPEIYYTLRRSIEGKSLAEFKDLWPQVLIDAATEEGKAQTEGKVPGAIDVQLTRSISPEGWLFAYTSTLPTSKGKSLSSLYVEQYYQGTKAIIGVVYRQPIKATDTLLRKAEVNEIIEAISPVLSTFEVKAISK